MPDSSNNLIYKGLKPYVEFYEFKGTKYQVQAPEFVGESWVVVEPKDISGMHLGVSHCEASSREELMALFKSTIGFDALENLEQLEKDKQESEPWTVYEKLSDEEFSKYFETMGKHDEDYTKHMKNSNVCAVMFIIFALVSAGSFGWYLFFAPWSSLWWVSGIVGFLLAKESLKAAGSFTKDADLRKRLIRDNLRKEVGQPKEQTGTKN